MEEVSYVHHYGRARRPSSDVERQKRLRLRDCRQMLKSPTGVRGAKSGLKGIAKVPKIEWTEREYPRTGAVVRQRKGS